MHLLPNQRGAKSLVGALPLAKKRHSRKTCQQIEAVLSHSNRRLLQQNLPQAVIAQMRCPSLRFEPRAKKSCRPLLEQFRPRVRNEAIAVWHLHARKRLRVENHCFVDNIAFRKDESYHRINLIGV